MAHEDPLGQAARGAQGPGRPDAPGGQNPIPQLNIPYRASPPEWTESRCGRQLMAWHRTMVVTASRLRMS